MWMRYLLLVIALVISACTPGDSDEDRAWPVDAKREVRSLEQELEIRNSALEETAEQVRRLKAQIAREGKGQRAGAGLLVSLPLLGSLTWDCNDEREFSFSFKPKATVTVERSIGGKLTKRRLHPGDEMSGPYVRADEYQEWVILYRHKPGNISASVVPMPAVDQGSCYVKNFSVEYSRRPW